MSTSTHQSGQNHKGQHCSPSSCNSLKKALCPAAAEQDENLSFQKQQYHVISTAQQKEDTNHDCTSSINNDHGSCNYVRQPLGVLMGKDQRAKSFFSTKNTIEQKDREQHQHHNNPPFVKLSRGGISSHLLDKSWFLLSDDLPPVKPLKWKPKVYKIYHFTSQHRTYRNTSLVCSQPSNYSATSTSRGKKLSERSDNHHYANHKNASHHVRRDLYLENAKNKRERIFNSKMIHIQETIDRKEQNRLRNKIIQKVQLRQEKLLLIVTLGSSLYNWMKDGPETLAKFRRAKSLDFAARTIQQKWKREMFIRKVFDARRIQQRLKTSKGQIKLFVQYTRQNLYSRVIRTFLVDASKYPLSYAFYKFRQSVLNAQKMIYGFIKCKQARLEALEEQWYRIEREIMVQEEYKIKRRIQQKHLLTDISHRKILSKDLVSIVKTVANDTEEQQSPSDVPMVVSSKDATSTKWVQILCRFYLEEIRHHHINQQSIKKGQLKKQDIQNYTTQHNDARKFLQGTHDIKILVSSDSFLYQQQPSFLLYCKHDHLQSKIKEFRKDPNQGILKIQAQLKIQDESCMANRYAAVCDSPCNTRITRNHFSLNDVHGEDTTSTSSGMNKTTGPLLQHETINMNPTLIHEIRTLFNLIDTNSKGFLTEENVESLFAFVGYGRGKKGAALISRVMADIVVGQGRETIRFHEFFEDLNTEINRMIQYPMELVLQAFDYFSAADIENEDDDEGRCRRNCTIQREQLIEILMHCPQQHLMSQAQVETIDELFTSHEDAASHLDCIGWINTEIGYYEIVRDMYRLWESKTLDNFLRFA